jgi:Membrane bound beta barrel domain (DUF5777)
MDGNTFPSRSGLLIFACIVVPAGLVLAQNSGDANGQGPSPANPPATIAAKDLGVSFVEGSTSEVLIEREGKQYVVDLATHAIREADASQAAKQKESSSAQAAPPAQSAPQDSTPADSEAGTEKKTAKVYKPGDDRLFNLPTGRPLERHGFYINFTHRFPFEAAFTGPGRGDTLLGLDDFAIPSFGFGYGVTAKFSVSIFRSPSIIGRPIELMAAYNFLDEHNGNPINAALRFSVDGQNSFSRNFTENFELIVSRSLGKRAQLYAVPTLSIHNRPLLGDLNGSLATPLPYQPCDATFAAGISPSFGAHPCANTFSLGLGGAIDIRPTVALVAETIPTLVNGRDLAIHRAEFSFGIQKKIWRHAFTFGFTNGPGVTVSQRAGTNATFRGDPTADKPSKMFVGFDLTRQVY